jgi:6-phosphogluconolactonase (cycloisomerase 2 family)
MQKPVPMAEWAGSDQIYSGPRKRSPGAMLESQQPKGKFAPSKTATQVGDAQMFLRKIILTVFLSGSAIVAFATTPVVTVKSPVTGASVGSPINYVASAASPSCPQGISAMRIYTAPGVNAYTVDANKLNVNINLPTGSYSTVVQAWDNCGGVGKTTVNITVSKITLPPPKFLYATEFSAGAIAEYTVNPLTGSIRATSQGSVSAHSEPVDIASDLGGYRLYVANLGSNDLDAYFINRSNGSLTQVPGSPYALPGPGLRAAVHPSGDFVYVSSSNSGGDTTDVSAFAVQANGSLVPVSGSPFSVPGGLGPLAMDPTGTYLYASADSGNTGAVAAFAINTTSGALTAVSGSPFVVPNYSGCSEYCQETPTDVAVDRHGKFVYAVLGIEDAITGFSIDQSTGALTDLPGSPYPEKYFCVPLGVCNYSWTMSLDPNGRFIYVSDSESNDFSIFSVNQNTGVPSYAGATSNGGICVPFTVNVDPSGSFIYNLGATVSGCQGTDAVLGFSINQGNGSLTSVPGSPFANANVHTTNTSQEKVVVTP